MNVNVPKAKKNAHLWVRDPDDWYVEPTWCSRRLFEIVPFNELCGVAPCLPPGRKRWQTVIVDPSCGTGRIVMAAAKAGYDAYGLDIKRRTDEPVMRGRIVLADINSAHYEQSRALGWPLHWVVTNPPFKLCAMRFKNDPPPPYIVRALSIAECGAAFLLPLDWIGGMVRSRWLATAGLWKLLVIAPRPSMPPGAVIEAGENPGGGTEDFAWFIFKKGHTGPWTGGWCDYRHPPVVDPEQKHLVNAVAALEG